MTASGETHGAGRHQGARGAVERQVDGEEHVRAVRVEVHGQVDRLAVGRARLVALHPAHLRRVQPHRLAVVERQPVRRPARALEDEACDLCQRD